MSFLHRKPRKWSIDPAPTPTADPPPTVDPPLSPPSWVQSIGHALDSQKASQQLAGAIMGYFAGLEWEGCPEPNVLVWEHGVVVVTFIDYAAEQCDFLFHHRYEVAITRQNRCGRIEMTPPMRRVVGDGRQER